MQMSVPEIPYNTIATKSIISKVVKIPTLELNQKKKVSVLSLYQTSTDSQVNTFPWQSCDTTRRPSCKRLSWAGNSKTFI